MIKRLLCLLIASLPVLGATTYSTSQLPEITNPSGQTVIEVSDMSLSGTNRAKKITIPRLLTQPTPTVGLGYGTNFVVDLGTGSRSFAGIMSGASGIRITNTTSLTVSNETVVYVLLTNASGSATTILPSSGTFEAENAWTNAPTPGWFELQFLYNGIAGAWFASNKRAPLNVDQIPQSSLSISPSQVTGLIEALDAKQETLIAGSGVTINPDNIISIADSSFESFHLATSGTTPAPIWTNTTAVAENRRVSVEAKVFGTGPTDSDLFDRNLKAIFRRNTGGSLTLVDSNNVSTMPDAPVTGVDAYFYPSGNDIKLYVTGTADNWNWRADVFTPRTLTNGTVAGSPITYLLTENFNGTGYDNSWTESGAGTLDEDYTTSPIEGAQSLHLVASAQIVNTWTTIPSNGEVDLYFRFRTASIPGTTVKIASIRAGTTVGCEAWLNADGTMGVRYGSGGNANTTATVTPGQDYHVWLHYIKHNGTSGFGRIAFSTDGTRPTSGSNYNQHPSSTVVGDASRIYFGHTGSSTFDFVIDKVRVNNVDIGSNPE